MLVICTYLPSASALPKANATVLSSWQALGAERHADAHGPTDTPIYASQQQNGEVPHSNERADASTSSPPLRAPLSAAYVGHPLAPNAIEQRQRIIDALVAAIKVMLVLLAISVCCLMYLSKEVEKMKEAIRHRIWKRR